MFLRNCVLNVKRFTKSWIQNDFKIRYNNITRAATSFVITQYYYESCIFREVPEVRYMVSPRLVSLRFDSSNGNDVCSRGIIHALEINCNSVRMRNRSADLAPGHREYVRSICFAVHTNYTYDRDNSRSVYRSVVNLYLLLHIHFWFFFASYILLVTPVIR